MIFRELEIPGAFVVDIEPHRDQRGFFARTFCEREFAEHGMRAHFVQSSVSWNAQRGTVRGLHFQRPPSHEAKLIACTRGRLFDAIVDLRPESATYRHHVVVELDPERRRSLYVPPGVAHGFQTLADDTEVSYWMSDYFEPKLAAGVRWNDPAFGIRWPLEDMTIAERDRNYPDFDAENVSRGGNNEDI